MARPRMNYFFGLDLGNGNLKIVTENFEQRIPSLMVDAVPSEALGHVSLNGENFIVGYGALKSSNAIATVDDRSIKIDKIERLYYGALTFVPNLPTNIKSYIVVSSHAWQSHKEAIKQHLEGSRTVALSGREIEINTEVLLVVPEGFGAVVDSLSQKVATLDFGSGTTLITPYQNKKPLVSVQAKLGGVNHLYEMISESMVSKNYGYRGDKREINRCLESGDFKINEVDISEIYDKQLQSWWNERLKDVRDEAYKLQKEGYEIICIGGGVALPKFSKILKAKKFTVVTDRPELTSARGLYKLALTQAKKKGIFVSETEGATVNA